MRKLFLFAALLVVMMTSVVTTFVASAAPILRVQIYNTCAGWVVTTENQPPHTVIEYISPPSNSKYYGYWEGGLSHSVIVNLRRDLGDGKQGDVIERHELSAVWPGCDWQFHEEVINGCEPYAYEVKVDLSPHLDGAKIVFWGAPSKGNWDDPYFSGSTGQLPRYYVQFQGQKVTDYREIWVPKPDCQEPVEYRINPYFLDGFCIGEGWDVRDTTATPEGATITFWVDGIQSPGFGPWGDEPVTILTRATWPNGVVREVLAEEMTPVDPESCTEEPEYQVIPVFNNTCLGWDMTETYSIPATALFQYFVNGIEMDGAAEWAEGQTSVEVTIIGYFPDGFVYTLVATPTKPSQGCEGEVPPTEPTSVPAGPSWGYKELRCKFASTLPDAWGEYAHSLYVPTNRNLEDFGDEAHLIIYPTPEWQDNVSHPIVDYTGAEIGRVLIDIVYGIDGIPSEAHCTQAA